MKIGRCCIARRPPRYSLSIDCDMTTMLRALHQTDVLATLCAEMWLEVIVSAGMRTLQSLQVQVPDNTIIIIIILCGIALNGDRLLRAIEYLGDCVFFLS